MAKPVSIFICGVQKGGTTSLHAYFSEHPQLSAPDVKEIHFFDDETINWARPDYSRLEAHFSPNDGNRLRFEATPVYSFWPSCFARVKAYNPAARLIFLFRDPFERAWSHWTMEYARRDETLAFGAAIREGRQRMEGLPPQHPRRRTWSYLERGLYAIQVQRALTHFPREQMLFLRSEDLRDNHVATLRSVAAFLGIGAFPDRGPKQEYPGPAVDPSLAPTEADRGLVAEFLGPNMEAFAGLTGLDISAWPVMRGPRAIAAPSQIPLAPIPSAPRPMAPNPPPPRPMAPIQPAPIPVMPIPVMPSPVMPSPGMPSPGMPSPGMPSSGMPSSAPNPFTREPLAARTPTLRPSPPRQRPNVLFIVADDMNSWTGVLGQQPDVRTPGIDALAHRGTLFTHAYCAAPYCNASRMSVFTGCLPTTTGVYANEPFWDAPQRRETYVEAFRRAGYYTFGAGKVFHGGYDYARAGATGSRSAAWIPMENRAHVWDRFETSAPEPLPPGRPLNAMFDFSRFASVPGLYHNFDWGPLPDAMEPALPDEIVCRSIEGFLTRPPSQPFFCAAGIYKPHLPWHVPKRFFDLYDPARLTLPTVRDDDLDDVPPLARQWAQSPNDHELVTSRGQWRRAVQGYLAAISYADWIIGRIVAALDRSGLADNTAIVFWSDNGFHLGEKLHWRKFVLWEEATRVPLIVVPPRSMQAVPRCHQPVSLVDMFPTIAELCGVEGPGDVDGQSLVEAMTRDEWLGPPAVMTWGKGNHSVRDGDWRYTLYRDGGQELYDQRADPHEWTNLADDPRFAPRIAALRDMLPDDQD